MPKPPYTLLKRGVYVERGLPGLVELSLVTSDGMRIGQAWLVESVYDERFRKGMEAFLDRVDPPVVLTVIPGGG
jgi:hypothetical protein